MYSQKYAGFWKRIGAHIIDQLLLGVVQTIFILPVWLYFFFEYFHLDDYQRNADFVNVGYEYYDDLSLSTFITIFLTIAALSIVIEWLYYALMESSAKQATVGKMVLSIKVTDIEGNRIGFGQATGRHFGKILSGLIFMIGYIMAGFTAKKQALHDMLADCLVVNSLYINYDEMFPAKELPNEETNI